MIKSERQGADPPRKPIIALRPANTIDRHVEDGPHPVPLATTAFPEKSLADSNISPFGNKPWPQMLFPLELKPDLPEVR